MEYYKDEIQKQEAEYAAAETIIKKQQANADNTKAMIDAAKNEYIQDVINTAVFSEKERRKRDKRSALAFWGVIIIVLIPVSLIGFPVGLWASIAIVIMIFAGRRGSNKSYAETINYKNRKNFFMKYYNEVPAAQRFTWKTINVEAPADSENASSDMVNYWMGNK